MSELGQIKAHLVAESSEWVQGLTEGAKALEQFERKNAAALKRIEREQKRAAAEAKANAKERAADMAAFGQAAQNLARNVTQFTSQFSTAAAAADDLADSLQGAFGERTAAMSASVQALGTGLGIFSDQAVGGAAKALEKFGQATEQNLARVVDAAAKTGQSVEGIAEAFGKFEKFGDGKSLLALQKTLGITGAEMEQFGAKIDSTGKVLADTPARLEAAKTALQSISDNKFSGAADAMADSSARLSGSLTLLKGEIGASAHALKESFTPYLLSAVEGVRGLSPEVKGAAGLMLEFGGLAVSAGASALMAGSQIAILAGNQKAVAVATRTANLAMIGFKGTLAFLAGPGGLLLGIALSVAAVTAEIQKANQALDALNAKDQKRNMGLQKGSKIVGKTAAQLQKEGVSVADINATIEGFQQAGELASNERNFAQRDRIGKTIQGLQKVRNDLTALNKQKPAGDLNAPSSKEQAKLDAKQAAAAEKTRKQSLAGELAVVNQGIAARKISASQAIESLEKIKSEHAKTAEERIAIDTRIAVLTGQLEQKKTADQKREEAKRTADHAKAERERLAEKRKAEAERKREQAKALKDQERAEKQSLSARKSQEVSSARETVREATAARVNAQAAEVLAPFGSTLPQFSGGPISGSIDDRRAATAAAEQARRAAAMAGNTAQAAAMGSRITRAVGKMQGQTAKVAPRSWKSMGHPVAIASTEKDLSPASDSAAIQGSTAGITAGAISEEVVKAFEAAPLVINVSIAGKQAASFKGSAGELSRASNVVNPNVPLGGA